ACCGKESLEEHHARLLGGLAAISVNCWPWEGAVALKEVGETMTQYHIVHNWFWLGAVDNLQEAATLLRTPAGFDHDGYKILCKPVLTGEFDVIVLSDQAAS
ncbi:MAG: endonuclease, partial [Enterobacter cloacae]|nr:endonuclease [Enterobacter cloacae]